MTERPWFRFYTPDWRADPALRMCSAGARGLWIEMLCLMHEAEPRGYLVVKGQPVSAKQLSALAGIPPKDTAAYLAELEAAEVFSRDNSTIYSRRMVRDTERAERDKANGKRGGNPGVKPRVNPSPTPHNTSKPLNQDTAQHVSEEHAGAKPQAPEPGRKAELDAIEAACREAAGLVADPSPSLLDLSPIVALLDAGYRLESDILPKMREAAARGKRGSSWRYYLAGITEAKAANQAVPAKPQTVVTPVIWITTDDPRWPHACTEAQRRLGKPILPMGSRHEAGTGYHFPAEIVGSVGEPDSVPDAPERRGSFNRIGRAG